MKSLVTANINKANHIEGAIKLFKKEEDKFIIICAGSTLYSSDSLMPCIGDKIKELNSEAIVFGTTKNPIHRGNFEAVIHDIINAHEDKKILVVIGAICDNDANAFKEVLINDRTSTIGAGVGDPKVPSIGHISVKINGGCDPHVYTKTIINGEQRETIINNVAQGIVNALK